MERLPLATSLLSLVGRSGEPASFTWLNISLAKRHRELQTSKQFDSSRADFTSPLLDLCVLLLCSLSSEGTLLHQISQQPLCPRRNSGCSRHGTADLDKSFLKNKDFFLSFDGIKGPLSVTGPDRKISESLNLWSFLGGLTFNQFMANILSKGVLNTTHYLCNFM